MNAAMNWRGCYGLYRKEVKRFTKVIVQTVLTPVLTSLLYLLVFAQAFQGRVEIYPGFSYLVFLVPGLVMMTVLQNAFANTSSSLMQSKMMGNLIFMQLAPLSALEILLAYVGAAVTRGLLVATGVYIVAALFLDMQVEHPLIVIVFVVGSSALLGALGLIAAIYAQQWEHTSAFQNFLIMPMTFLAGVFYSVKQLPPFWASLSSYNPFYYMVDGFRYGFLGVSDIAIGFSAIVLLIALSIVLTITYAMLATGYRLRN